MKQKNNAMAKTAGHTPIRREHEGSDTAVVFIHGFMGSPGQFTDLIDAVYDNGCSCFSVLLPGHGVCMREFVKFGNTDWMRHVQDEVTKIRVRYAEIVLVGHSIGGLLALNICMNKENRISGVMLIQTPLKVYILNPKSLMRKLRLLTYPKNNEIKAAYIKSKGITKSNALHYPLIMRPVISLFRLISSTRKRLAEVLLPVYIFYSENDETTSNKSAKLLQSGLINAQVTIIPLKKSWHAYYHGDERKIITQKLLELIRQTATREAVDTR